MHSGLRALHNRPEGERHDHPNRPRTNVGREHVVNLPDDVMRSYHYHACIIAELTWV